MYLRWCERKGYQTEILDETEGEEAGIKTVSIMVTGQYAYGYLRPEKGVHRLVRLSPYDSAHRRHTSFAQVEVLPEAAQEDPLVISTRMTSKWMYSNLQVLAGKTCKKTPLPSGSLTSPLVLLFPARMNVLKCKTVKMPCGFCVPVCLDLAQMAQDKHLADLRGVYQKAEWGSQIRSYVLHPYQMVKDHRTEYEVGNSQSVLDGDMDGFIEAYLASEKIRSTGGGFLFINPGSFASSSSDISNGFGFHHFFQRSGYNFAFDLANQNTIISIDELFDGCRTQGGSQKSDR